MDIEELSAYKYATESQLQFTERLIKQKLDERDTYLAEIAVINYRIIGIMKSGDIR